SVKAVLLEGTMRGWELKGRARAELGPAEPAPTPAPAAVPTEENVEGAAAAEPVEATTEVVEDLRLSRALGAVAEQLGGLRADLVAVALPGSAAASPLVTLLFTEQKKIDATLGFEVESLLPFDVDEALYD